MSTLLLVDDVALFLELEKSFLSETGHRLVTASSAEEALKLLPEVKPDLLLLDLYLPGFDGDALCRELRNSNRWQNLPILMVTAAGKEIEVRKCLDAGCDDYLTKPINKQQLLQKVARLLGGRRGRNSARQEMALKVRVQGRGRTLEAQTQDISRSGIFVRSEEQLEVGAVVDLQLDFEGHQIEVLGKVRRVKTGSDAGMGIYFVAPEAEGKQALAELTRRLQLEGDKDGPQHPPPAEHHPELLTLSRENDRLRQEHERLLARIGELEQENRDFAEQLVRSDEINNNLTNLYIASSKLHATLDYDQVLATIEEVVINFVGAERFALLMLDDEQQVFELAFAEGVEAAELGDYRPDAAPLKEVLEEGSCRLAEGLVSDHSDDLGNPLALIPLQFQGQGLGVLLIFRLFVQKESFADIDHQLFDMMAEHAATALFSAGLYTRSERKRQTFQGMMDLLLK